MFSKSSTFRLEPQDTGAARPAEDAVCAYSSETLFRGQREVRIDHQGSTYRLRITRTGGLILNK